MIRENRMNMTKFYNKHRRYIPVYIIALLVVVMLIIATATLPRSRSAGTDAASGTEAPTAPTAKPDKVMIEGVPVILQAGLEAGCETYACTMLLQYLGCDIDEYRFANDYLFCKPISYDEGWNRHGPDLRSAFAGTAYEGYGIYAPAMAKSMNSYFEDAGLGYTAEDFSGMTLQELAEKYTDKGVPVMVWITTNMMEPYDKASWIVDYVDENATTEIGDTYTWQKGEHCVVLIGYDQDNYYFADSVAGDVSVFDKELSETRFAQMGSQGIVVNK